MVDQGRHVLMVTPYSLSSNPYMGRLIGALEAAGERVELARGRSPILLWRALRRHGVPRIVHLQWHHPYLTSDRLPGAILRSVLFFLQCAMLRALGARFVWTVHNIVEHERRHVRWELLTGRLLARLVYAPMAHCAEAADRVSEAFRVPRDRVRVVPHGIIEVEGSFDRIAERRALELSDEDVFLLNFGRVRRYKGVDDLLDVFRRTVGDRLKLAVAGFPDDPELAEELERQAAEDPRVTLRLEALEDEELARLLSACDAVVLPYRDSLTSGAAVLAAAHGRPVIAPRLGCLLEFPSNGALLYDPAAGDGLERALGEAVEAPLEAMGAVARSFVEQFPWERIAALTIEAYHAARGPAAGTARGL